MKDSMTVGELKKALEGMDESLPVYITVEPLINPKYQGLNYEYYTAKAVHAPSSSISNEHFNIITGEGFGW